MSCRVASSRCSGVRIRAPSADAGRILPTSSHSRVLSSRRIESTQFVIFRHPTSKSQFFLASAKRHAGLNGTDLIFGRSPPSQDDSIRWTCFTKVTSTDHSRRRSLMTTLYLDASSSRISSAEYQTHDQSPGIHVVHSSDSIMSSRPSSPPNAASATIGCRVGLSCE
jgi:hypothetical protein